MSDTDAGIEKAFRACINENRPRHNVVRIELHGIARFACWWFVVWSALGGVAAIIAALGSVGR
jgi:hypothetical protein